MGRWVGHERREEREEGEEETEGNESPHVYMLSVLRCLFLL